MNENKPKRGTFVHGIAASQAIDSSGERILIEGVDISSLTKSGVLNFEHDSKSPSSIVGKIWEAKKILKESDCESDHHKYFWNKVKIPYIYIAGELLDSESVAHKEALEIAAMIRFDGQESLNNEARKMINFSIEGSRVEKQGSNITKCIARKVSVTLTPCNHTCIAEELKIDPSAPKEPTSGDFKFIQDMMSKSDEASCQILKGKNPFLYKNEEVTMTAKEAVKEHKRLVAVLESPSHKDDKVEAKKQRKELKEYKEKLAKVDPKKAHPKDPIANHGKVAPKAPAESKQKEYAERVMSSVKQKLTKYDSNVRKALTASCGMGSPSAKVQDVAKSEFLYKNEQATDNNSGAKIGTTQSGKPVFSHAKVMDYKGFTPQDHVDAAEFHRLMIAKVPGNKDKEMHMNKMRLHNAAFSTGREKQIKTDIKNKTPGTMPRPMAALPMPMPKLAAPAIGLKPAPRVIPKNNAGALPQTPKSGVMGYSASASNYGKTPTAPKGSGLAVSAPPVALKEPVKIAKSEQREIMKMLGERAFEAFEKKEELMVFLAEKLPNLSEKELKAIAKAVAYTSEKKKEAALKALMED